MAIGDYDAVIALMTSMPGISLRDADSADATARYLERNPGLSFVATDGARLVSCIMSGHDGRRGYLQHLIVAPDYRRQGMATMLVERCVAALNDIGIAKCHIDVFKTNTRAAAFWAARGWVLRTDIERYSFISGGGANA